ncbi:MAG TPA: prenyltransferase/squalene oxidase repeat-containing protein [Planctomycetota bacterium]|nr:prenyltransferase/squalene oxidase repeat-containing protein [Planctomycetota bacterium]
MSPRTSAAIAGAAALAFLGIALRAPAQAQEKPPAPPAGGGAPAAAGTPRERADALLRKGLAWLKTQQQPNGSFGRIPAPEGTPPGEAGMSALALRAFAKAPPALRKELDLEPVMDKVAAYLVSLQQADGSIANPKGGLTTYRTSLSLMALAAFDARRFAPQIEKARSWLVAGQFCAQNLGAPDDAVARKNPSYGGWGYDERTGTTPKADLSNSHFALEALHETPAPADAVVWARAVTFLQRCQNRSESNDLTPAGVEVGDDGGFIYDPGADESKSMPVTLPDGKKQIPSYASMTYAGLMSMLYASVKKDDPRVKAARGWIEKNYTLQENRGLGPRASAGSKQGLFYYFHTFAKALDAWNEPAVTTPDGVEHRWADDLVNRLAELQRPDGSWANDTKRWWEDDPVLCTSYALVALDIAYHPWIDGGEARGGENDMPKSGPPGK